MLYLDRFFAIHSTRASSIPFINVMIMVEWMRSCACICLHSNREYVHWDYVYLHICRHRRRRRHRLQPFHHPENRTNEPTASFIPRRSPCSALARSPPAPIVLIMHGFFGPSSIVCSLERKTASKCGRAYPLLYPIGSYGISEVNGRRMEMKEGEVADGLCIFNVG